MPIDIFHPVSSVMFHIPVYIPFYDTSKYSIMKYMKNSLPSIIFKLGLLSLLNDISSEMVFPLLPLLLVTLPGGGPLAIGI